MKRNKSPVSESDNMSLQGGVAPIDGASLQSTVLTASAKAGIIELTEL